jgi:6-pyruvoyltetrahydropterin/6-carboxytetrahydropterin synthase
MVVEVFVVKACTTFSAAHRIEGHPRCGNIHGHNYRVCIGVAEDKPLEVDLDVLEEWLRRNVYERFDHKYLNAVLGGKGEKPVVTSEELAVLIARELESMFPNRVVYVEVCETGDLCVEYRPKGR